MTTLIPKVDLKNGGSTPTGAVNRPINEKLAELVSVKDFGAIGNGTTDDTVAIQNALNASTNVYFPIGDYLVTTLNIASGTVLNGAGVPQSSTSGTKILYNSVSGSCFVIDASSVTKTNCQINNMLITSNVTATSSVGIEFKGVDANSINDWHSISNILVSNFTTQIKVTGRMIWSSFTNVLLEYGTYGFIADAVTVFNANTLINVRCGNMEQEGIKITNANSCTLIGCNIEGCNLSNTNGVAAVKLSNTQGIVIENCYLENNGPTCTNTKNTPASCSYGIWFTGTYTYSPKIIGGYNVTTGIPVYITSLINGGSIEGGRYSSISGDVLYITSLGFNPINNGGVPFIIYPDAKIDNLDTDYINIKVDANQNRFSSIAPSQTPFITNGSPGTSLDCYRIQSISFSTGIPFAINISTLYNNYPGQQLIIRNFSSYDINMQAAVMASGVTSTVATGYIATFGFLGFPNDRKAYLISSIAL
jgi:hypothetical protein